MKDVLAQLIREKVEVHHSKRLMKYLIRLNLSTSTKMISSSAPTLFARISSF